MKQHSIIFYLLAAGLVSACSPINSMAPFDDKQAAIVAISIAGSPLPKRSQLPIQRKTQERTNENDNGS